jgi:hypothetical protein
MLVLVSDEGVLYHYINSKWMDFALLINSKRRVSAIPGENTTTPKGPKLSKDEVIELLGNDEILSAVYDHIVAEYPEISVTKAPGKTGVFFFCPRLVMLVHEYQSNELLSLAEQLSKPLN